jgi:glycosyltransferase involved in cell wall biosynthesis
MVLPRALSIRADIYQFHDHELLLPMWVLKWLCRKKVVYDIHENIAAQFISQMRIFLRLPLWVRKILARLYRLIEQLLTWRMGIIESDMIEGRFEPRSISIRNLPILAGHARKDKSIANFQESKSVLVYVGGVSVPRGVWEMLKIAKRLRSRRASFEMRIIGPFQPTSLEENVRKYVHDNELDSYVHFTGRVPYEDALHYIGKATLGISLLHHAENYRFALPTKILEYMMFGIPVISSDIRCATRYVKKYDVGIIVNCEEIDSTVDDIDTLLNDAERMLHYSRNGINAIWNGELNWEQEFPRLLLYYNWLLGKSERNWVNHYHRYVKDYVEGDW